MTDGERKSIPGLLDEEPLFVYPSLAVRAGLNKAVMLQRLHFLLKITEKAGNAEHHFFDGRWWVYNTYEQWREKHFPWMAKNTIQRLFLALEREGVVMSCASPFDPNDQTKYYTIKYEDWVTWFENPPQNEVGGTCKKKKWDPQQNEVGGTHNKKERDPQQNEVGPTTNCGGDPQQNEVGPTTNCGDHNNESEPTQYTQSEPTSEPTSSSESADPEAAAANLAAGDDDDWKLVEPEAVRVGFWKNKLPQLRTLEPARALALVWDAQDRGQSNPAGLLAAMLDNEQEPPEKLVEAARVWLEHGGEYTREQAERAAQFAQHFPSAAREDPERSDPPALEPAPPDNQGMDGTGEPDTDPVPDVIDGEAQRLVNLAAAWLDAIPLMVERTGQTWWEDTSAVPVSDFGLAVQVPVEHIEVAEQRRILATNMLQDAGGTGFVQTVAALPAAPNDTNLPDWDTTWAAVVERLRPRLEPATFDDGLKVSRVSGYADGILTVKAPDPDGPLTNLQHVIEQMLRDVAGQRVRVAFEAAPAAATVGGGA